jgi:hypothetical protein
MNVIEKTTAAVRVTTEQEDITKIYLGRGHFATVNSNTFERLRLGRFRWSAQQHKRGYVYATAYCGEVIYLHRVVVGAKKGQCVDHKDRDTLNCREENLRIATPAQNRANQRTRRTNSSGLKGVSWSPGTKKWMAAITHRGRRYYLGCFQDKRRAAVAHDRAALAIHGEFAGLNYPDRGTRPRMPKGGFIVGKKAGERAPSSPAKPCLTIQTA